MLKLLDYQKDHAESIERALLSPNRVALDATFDTVTRAVAAVENETLYIDEEDFAGYGIKRGGEAIDKCSTMSDILIIDNQGVLSVRRVQEKFYVGKKLLHISVLRPTDDWVFNMIYRDGKEGITYAKRFKLGGFTRDREYHLTQGTKGSRVFFFTIHKTEEESSAMHVNVYLKNQLRRPIPFDFGKLRVKGRGVLGNIVTKNQVERISRIMPSAAGEEGTDAPAPEMPAPTVGTLSALLDGSTQAPLAEPQPPAPAAAPPTPTDEQQGLDDSIHEQMGFEF